MTARVMTRRDTAANWTLNNPILRVGEEGLEMDTKQYKVGDGVTDWQNLPYWNSRPGVKTIATATYTLTAADEAYLLLFTNAAGCVVTGPASTSEELPTAFICHLHQEAASPAGQVEFVAAFGATTRAAIGLKTRTQYSSLSIIVQALDTYKIIGDAVA